MPSIVIVGGGPVGLYTCLLLLERYEDVDVIVMEKRSTYVRSHRVYVNMCRIPTSTDQYMNGGMSIQEVEATLRNHCDKNPTRVRIVHREVDATNLEVLECYRPSMIVFADGARSKARNTFFGGEKFRYQYTSACNVSYRHRYITGSSNLQLNHIYRLQKLTDCYFNEQVKDDGEIHLVVLGNFSNDQLQYKARVIINARRVELGDEVVPETLRYSFYDLDIFRSRSVCAQWKGIPLYLVGDAAAGIPFQQGLNVGFQCARALVRNGRKSYSKGFTKIVKNILHVTDSRANMMDVYLTTARYFRNSVFEWQRWSRSYESLLLQLSKEEVNLFTDELRSHPITQDRQLVLEWWKSVLLH